MAFDCAKFEQKGGDESDDQRVGRLPTTLRSMGNVGGRGSRLIDEGITVGIFAGGMSDPPLAWHVSDNKGMYCIGSAARKACFIVNVTRLTDGWQENSTPEVGQPFKSSLHQPVRDHEFHKFEDPKD